MRTNKYEVTGENIVFKGMQRGIRDQSPLNPDREQCHGVPRWLHDAVPISTLMLSRHCRHSDDYATRVPHSQQSPPPPISQTPNL